MPQSFANDMINNKSIGVVNGNITQIARGGSHNEINVGSIVGGKAKNVSVQAYVNGDMIVKTNRGKSVVLDIGSYRSKK